MVPLTPRSRTPRIRVLAGGHLLIGLTIALGLAAAHSGQNVLQALVALLLGFQAVSGLRSSSVLRRLRVAVDVPSAVDAGEDVALLVEVTNGKRRRAAVSLELEVVLGADGRLHAGRALVGRVEPGATVRVPLRLTGRARGAARVVELRIASAYPCDLFKRTVRLPIDADVLVRPRRRRGRPSASAAAREDGGRRRLAVRGAGDVRGLRPWRDGDPLRAVHWRATARTGVLVVREEDREARAPWAVVLAPAAAEVEDSVEGAAAVLRTAVAEGRPASLCVAGESAPRAVGTRRALDAALDALARFVPTDAPPPSGRAGARAFLLGARAAPPAGALAVERAPFRWLAPARIVEPDAPADVAPPVAGRARSDLAAWALVSAVAAGLAAGAPLAAAPQALAATALLVAGPAVERFSPGVATRLVLLAAAAAVGVLPGGGGPALLVRFLCALAATVLLRRRTSGEHGFLFGLFAAETAVAAALSTSVLAVPAAVATVVVGQRAVGSWHRLRSAGRVARTAGPAVAVGDGARLARAADLASLATVLVAAPLFLVLPRTDVPILSFSTTTSASVPGVGDEVRLGGLSTLGDLDEVVARAAPRDAVARDAPPYFRVVAYDRLERGVRWTSDGSAGDRSRSYDPDEGVLWVPGAVEVGGGRWWISAEASAGTRLPLPETPARIEFLEPRPDAVRRDADGSVRPERARPVPRWTYEVATGVTRSHFGVGPRPVHLERPPAPVAAALAPLVEAATSGATSPRAKAEALEAWLRARCRYALDARLDRRDPLDDFLFRTRAGHCELFAAGLAVSLRLAGVPARVVGGYHASRWNDDGAFWLVRRRDAHAWVEAWLGSGDGWVRFDATPASARAADPYAGALGWLARWRDAAVFTWNRHVIGFDAAAQRDVALAVRDALARWGEDGAPGVAAAAALVVGGLATVVLVVSRRRRARAGGRGFRTGGDGAAAAATGAGFYGEALALLDRRGVPRRPAETPGEFARRAARELPRTGGDAFAALTCSFEGCRYGGGEPPPEPVVTRWLVALAEPVAPGANVDRDGIRA